MCRRIYLSNLGIVTFGHQYHFFQTNDIFETHKSSLTENDLC